MSASSCSWSGLAVLLAVVATSCGKVSGFPLFTSLCCGPLFLPALVLLAGLPGLKCGIAWCWVTSCWLAASDWSMMTLWAGTAGSRTLRSNRTAAVSMCRVHSCRCFTYVYCCVKYSHGLPTTFPCLADKDGDSYHFVPAGQRPCDSELCKLQILHVLHAGLT